MSMTPAQIVAQIDVFATSVTPFLPPGVALAITLAKNALHAVQTAQNAGQDVSDAQLQALFAADDKAKADDLLAQQEALAKGG